MWSTTKNKFWKIERLHKILFVKKKNTAHAAQRWFCRVNQRQNESGVLRGGKFFRGLFLTEVVGLTVITNHFLCCVQNEHDHILWMELDQSTKSVGFTRKIPRCVEYVKRVLKNLLKWSEKSMTYLVALGKNTLCESEQIPFSVCGKSFYCQQQQAVACAFKTQVAIKRQGRLLPSDLAVLCYVIN